MACGEAFVTSVRAESIPRNHPDIDFIYLRFCPSNRVFAWKGLTLSRADFLRWAISALRAASGFKVQISTVVLWLLQDSSKVLPKGQRGNTAQAALLGSIVAKFLLIWPSNRWLSIFNPLTMAVRPSRYHHQWKGFHCLLSWEVWSFYAMLERVCNAFLKPVDTHGYCLQKRVNYCFRCKSRVISV